MQKNENAKSAEIAEVLNKRMMREKGIKHRLENAKIIEAQRQMIYRMKNTAMQIVANTEKGEFPLHSTR